MLPKCGVNIRQLSARACPRWARRPPGQARGRFHPSRSNAFSEGGTGLWPVDFGVSPKSPFDVLGRVKFARKRLGQHARNEADYWSIRLVTSAATAPSKLAEATLSSIMPSVSRRIVFMFAGQGSQYYSMGRELYERIPSFRHWLDLCSEHLKPALKLFLAEFLYRERPNRFAPFDQVLLTHPAVFCINYSMAKTLIEEGVQPNALLGYSLGELVAWTLAGTLQLEQALNMVVEMARLVEQRTPPAAMLAVLVPASLMETHPEVFRGATLACVNYAANFVVTGSQADLAATEKAVKHLGVPCQMLPITRGFHSPLIDPAEAPFVELASRLNLRPEQVPVFSSMLGRQASLTDIDSRYFWNVIRQRVTFWETVRLMESQSPAVYIDVGPSGTLASFIRQILGPESVSSAHPLMTPFGKELERIQKLRAGLDLR